LSVKGKKEQAKGRKQKKFGSRFVGGGGTQEAIQIKAGGGGRHQKGYHEPRAVREAGNAGSKRGKDGGERKVDLVKKQSIKGKRSEKNLATNEGTMRSCLTKITHTKKGMKEEGDFRIKPQGKRHLRRSAGKKKTSRRDVEKRRGAGPPKKSPVRSKHRANWGMKKSTTWEILRKPKKGGETGG